MAILVRGLEAHLLGPLNSSIISIIITSNAEWEGRDAIGLSLRMQEGAGEMISDPIRSCSLHLTVCRQAS